MLYSYLPARPSHLLPLPLGDVVLLASWALSLSYGMPYLNQIYTALHASFGAWGLVTVGTFIVHSGFWLIPNVAYFLMDKYQLFLAYRIYPTLVPLSVQLSIAKELALMHMVGLLPFHLASFPLFELYGIATEPATLPTLSVFLAQLTVCNLIEDCLFYWSHRILHWPLLFRLFHYKHHQFDQVAGHTFALNAEYANPVDSFLNAVLPLFGALACWQLLTPWPMHLLTLWCWVAFRQLRASDSHSGYDLPFHPLKFFRVVYGGPRFHMTHHTLYGRKTNYGAFRVWDILMGTTYTGTKAS